jgi:hypothetical protein
MEIVPSSYLESETQLEFFDAEEDLEEVQQQTTFDITELSDAVKTASEGALTAKTMSNYRRYLSLKTVRTIEHDIEH